MKLRNLKIYWDKNDWWWGYYRGPNHHYFIPPPIFCLVFRWDRKKKQEEIPDYNYGLGQILDMPIIEREWVPKGKAFFLDPKWRDNLYEAMDRIQYPQSSDIILHPDDADKLRKYFTYPVREYKSPTQENNDESNS